MGKRWSDRQCFRDGTYSCTVGISAWREDATARSYRPAARSWKLQHIWENASAASRAEWKKVTSHQDGMISSVVDIACFPAPLRDITATLQAIMTTERSFAQCKHDILGIVIHSSEAVGCRTVGLRSKVGKANLRRAARGGRTQDL